MRSFRDGATITVEPFRSAAFPVICDLVVDRSALDRIQQAGGYTGVNAGPKPEPNANPISPEDAEEAIDAAICIGCGACVAACPNGAAMLFTGAKVTHLSRLPQGQPGRYTRVQDMVEQMDSEGFGGCTNFGECEAACPKEISIRVIGRLNRDYLLGVLYHARNPRGGMKPQ
jgi:succinate dehydrogenase / fumarate reductase iron-sulfur subunit